MFTIIGGDGKEYGPVTVEQVQQWLAAGRANLATQAKKAGEEQWRRLGDFDEFSGRSTPQPPPVAVDSALADRGSRLGAIVIDRLIVLFCTAPGFVLLGTAFFRAVLNGGRNFDVESLDASRVLLGFGVLTAAVLVVGIVQMWMLVTRGQSIGKRLMGVRIVRFTDGTNPGFVRVILLRGLVPSLLTVIPYLGLAFGVTDVCFIFRDDKRCLHDLIADTKVVKA